MVGAGATPDRLVDFIGDLNFKRFLIPPTPSPRSFPLGWVQRKAVKFWGGQAVLDLLSEQGMHSSAEIEELGLRGYPVRFGSSAA